MGVPVKELLEGVQRERLGLMLIAGEKGLTREVTTSRIQKPGLLLTGLLEELHADRLQIFGAAEINYLKRLGADELEDVLKVFRPELPAIIVARVTKYLEERLAPSTTLHGVLVDVLGVGVLIIGKSGIGKSECALDMVARGYRLVSDDVVLVKRMPPSVLFGSSSELIKYHMEIRGLGIINVKDLYGITAIREKKQMDIVVELVKWESETEYDRLGLEENTYNILGVDLPYLRVPVSPGRRVATIVQVAARNQILKIMGHHPAKALERELDNAMKGFRK